MKRSALLQPLLIIAAALAGLALGHLTPLGAVSDSLVEPALVAMLFFTFLPVQGGRFLEALRHPQFSFIALGINFIWTPIIAFVLGALFFSESLDLRIGLLMLLATPCTDWYLVFTRMARGNVELAASILPLNLLLQILLLPCWLLLFFGGRVETGVALLLASALLVLVIPCAAAWLVRAAARRTPGASRVLEACLAQGDRAQLVLLCLAVLFMFAAQADAVLGNRLLLLRVFAPLAIFFAGNLALVRRVGIRAGMRRPDVIALNFTTLARNAPLALAVAVAAFPDRPLVALALVVGPLLELPVLAVIAWFVRWIADDTPTVGNPAAPAKAAPRKDTPGSDAPADGAPSPGKDAG